MIGTLMDMVEFVDRDDAGVTLMFLDQVDPPVDLSPSITLNAGSCEGIPVFVIYMSGVGELSAVITSKLPGG